MWDLYAAPCQRVYASTVPQTGGPAGWAPVPLGPSQSTPGAGLVGSSSELSP